MHSREPDLIDARALVESYIRFGSGNDAVPEFTRPVIVSIVAEVLSIARKQENATVSSIADACSRSPRDLKTLALIAEICRSRLIQLSGLVNEETANVASLPASSGRPPTPQYVDRRHSDHSTQVNE